MQGQLTPSDLACLIMYLEIVTEKIDECNFSTEVDQLSSIASIIADEPTEYLDAAATQMVIDVLDHLDEYDIDSLIEDEEYRECAAWFDHGDADSID